MHELQSSAAGAGRIILLMRLDNARVNVAMRFMEVVPENHAPKRNGLIIREEKFTCLINMNHAELVNHISCNAGFILYV